VLSSSGRESGRMRFRCRVSSRFSRCRAAVAESARVASARPQVNLRDAPRATLERLHRAARTTHRARDTARACAIATMRATAPAIRVARSGSTASKKTVDSQARRV